MQANLLSWAASDRMSLIKNTYHGLRVALLLPLFLFEYFRNICNQDYACSPASYQLLRYLYVLTRGSSQHILSAPYSFLWPSCQPADSCSGFLIAQQIQRNGYHQLQHDGKARLLCKAIKEKLDECPVIEVGGLNSGRSYTSFGEAEALGTYRSARLGYKRCDVVGIPEIWDLLRHIGASSIASSYLKCSPVITSVDSWYVVPFVGPNSEATEAYSHAAQSFHYDLDWIKFIKFFINLDTVDQNGGPFEFVPGSHKQKQNDIFGDRRLSESEVESLCTVQAIGPVGSVFIADTSGFHRDGRATQGYKRHVLQVEFAVSTFGAKFQYDKVNEQCLIPRKAHISDEYSDRALLLWQKQKQ